jgi:ABC-type enterochelin transport system permease subunit
MQLNKKLNEYIIILKMSYYLNNQFTMSSFGKYDSKNLGVSSIKSVASGYMHNKLNMDN